MRSTSLRNCGARLRLVVRLSFSREERKNNGTESKGGKMAMVCQSLIPLLLLSAAISAVEVLRPRGVPLSKKHFYVEGKPFTCLDGSRTIPFDRVNDDYCDCQDGSDEPGTPACPNGSFHCTNAGYRPVFIPSSRINDGICDCCDATDEYNSGASCPNTCRELGRKEKESLQKLAEIAKEGFILKQQLIQEAKRGLEEKKTKASELEASKKQLEETLEALRTVKEAAEEPEKEAKERHLKAWEDEKAAVRAEKDNARMAEVFIELDDDGDGFVSLAELQSHTELDTDSDGSFTETEAQALLGGVDKADRVAFEAVWKDIKDKYISESQAPAETPQEEMPHGETREPHSENDSENYPEGEIPEDDDDDDDQEEEDDDEEDDDDPDEADYNRPPAVQEKKDDEGTMPPYDEETQILIDAAQKAREQFDEAERALRELDDQLKSIEKETNSDFGPSAEFAYLYSQCYEMPTGEYIYSFCPFNRVTQKPKYGGSETSLGTWGRWDGPEGDVYAVMKYENGMGCWQGPNRSTTVKLKCGRETAVTSTTEPSRCEYLMEFTTPALCQEPKTLDPMHEHIEL
ncbi:glucosidase 2 subunit beta [Syngnathus scovelli]|uniref:glucosidase 2 subunit beta n=1 Tax=Syngnathus scovelli TaxID=161590 RepID=UPI00210F6102|nr:glucosidase 2 subunit beta [Syngnathus scovelli]